MSEDSELPIIKKQLIEHLRKIIKIKRKTGLTYSELTKLTGIASCTLGYLLVDEKSFAISMPTIFRALKKLDQTVRLIVSDKEVSEDG